jgi:hypothetical protein
MVDRMSNDRDAREPAQRAWLFGDLILTSIILLPRCHSPYLKMFLTTPYQTRLYDIIM